MSPVLILQLLYKFETFQNQKFEGKTTCSATEEQKVFLNRLLWTPRPSKSLTWPRAGLCFCRVGADSLLIMCLAFLNSSAIPEVIWMQKWEQVLGSFSGPFLFEFLFFSPNSLETSFLLTPVSEIVEEQAGLRALSALHRGISCKRQTWEQPLRKGGL